MSDNLDKYLPEFDEEEARSKLIGFTREQLLNMLVYAYKEKRLWAKMLDGETKSSTVFKRSLMSLRSLAECPVSPLLKISVA